MATLQRVASRWQIVALTINDVVGSEVYLLPAAAAVLRRSLMHLPFVGCAGLSGVWALGYG
jgi:hypothetical protein